MADLTTGELIFVALAVFAAGIVRGFSGFALSALIMASCVAVLPPVQLIPICTVLEIVASTLLVRGGFAEADRRMVYALQAGAVVGIPAGLYLTTTIAPEMSGLVALGLILGLAMLQLARVRLPVDSGPGGALVAGTLAGLATGLASVGGMVIALYTLARQAPPRIARASMILSVFLGGTLATLWQVVYGMITPLSLLRAALLALPCLAGVWLGRRMFTARYERFYRPFCLSLLMALAALGLAQRLAR